MADRGYYAVLGVNFRSEFDEIARAYKKLALKFHPDKNPSPEAADEFQRITTSYHVIMDEQKRKNYLRLYLLRCYMSQEVPRPGGPLRPHYAFMVEKSKFAMGAKSERLLTFDLLARCMTSLKKDKELKQFPLSAITSVAKGEKALELTISFKDNHPYYIRCRCQDHYATLLEVLNRICSLTSKGTEITDDALQVLCDDTDSPPSSITKSKVIKRAESFASGLVHDWQPRFMVMGATQLVLFRDTDLQYLVNIIPLTLLKVTADTHDRTCFQLSTSYWKASFRVLTEDVAARWASALSDQKAVAAAAAREAAAMAPAKGGVSGEERRSTDGPRRTKRPSVIFFEGDLGSVLSQQMGHSLLPGPDGNLAPADVVLTGGWLQYHDDNGVPYFYHPQSDTTAWEAPDGVDVSLRLDGGEEPLLKSPKDSEEQRQAQLAALREDGASSATALAEAKAAMLAVMHQMERGLNKARRGIEAERPLGDLAPQFEALRSQFDKMSTLGADFERRWVARDEHQRTFVHNKRDYLDGLQKHMFGDVPDQLGVGTSSAATKIFRSAAYVAEQTFKSGAMTTVL